jgi:small subunit ribosomal protein S6
VREYETTLIVQPEISDEGVQTLCQRLDGVLEKHGAIRLLHDDAGKRRLAYEIRKFQKGRYITLSYLDEGKAVPDLERSLRLDDSILRFLTVQVADEVKDVEARKAEAAEQQRIREQKAAERAEREAEEAARAAEEETARAQADETARAQAEQKAQDDARAASDDEAGDNDDDEAPGDDDEERK